MGELYPRDNCSERLRQLLQNDPWLTRFALHWAAAELELGQLNALVQAVEDVRASESYAARTRYSSAMAERFGL